MNEDEISAKWLKEQKELAATYYRQQESAETVEKPRDRWECSSCNYRCELLSRDATADPARCAYTGRRCRWESTPAPLTSKGDHGPKTGSVYLKRWSCSGAGGCQFECEFGIDDKGDEPPRACPWNAFAITWKKV